MPLPSPNKGESQNDFISRCISFETKASPDRPAKQVQAMCYTKWRSTKGLSEMTEEEIINMFKNKVVLFSEEGEYGKEESGLYRKQVLRFGKWRHPEDENETFEINAEVVKRIVENFDKGVPHEAPVVLTHTDNPMAKVGTVKKFIATEMGLDAIISVEDDVIMNKVESEDSAPGVSCWLDLAYKDKQSGEELGAVVKHVALVNHPYIEGLSGFRTVSLSEDSDAEHFIPLLMGEDEFKGIGDNMPEKLTKENAIKFLEENEKIDIKALLSERDELKSLQDRIDKGELKSKEDFEKELETDKAKLGDDLMKKIREQLKLDEGDDKLSDISGVVKALLDKVTELSEQAPKVAELQNELSEMKADKELSTLLSEGRVLPKEKDSLIKLYVKDRELFNEVVKVRKEGKPLIELTTETGVSKEEIEEKEKAKAKDEEETLKRNVEAAEEEGAIAKRT